MEQLPPHILRSCMLSTATGFGAAAGFSSSGRPPNARSSRSLLAWDIDTSSLLRKLVILLVNKRSAIHIDCRPCDISEAGVLPSSPPLYSTLLKAMARVSAHPMRRALKPAALIGIDLGLGRPPPR
jgi:hypothetical protein